MKNKCGLNFDILYKCSFSILQDTQSFFHMTLVVWQWKHWYWLIENFWLGCQTLCFIYKVRLCWRLLNAPKINIAQFLRWLLTFACKPVSKVMRLLQKRLTKKMKVHILTHFKEPLKIDPMEMETEQYRKMFRTALCIHLWAAKNTCASYMSYDLVLMFRNLSFYVNAGVYLYLKSRAEDRKWKVFSVSPRLALPFPLNFWRFLCSICFVEHLRTHKDLQIAANYKAGMLVNVTVQFTMADWPNKI